MLLLQHPRDVFVLVRENPDELLVLSAQPVQQGLVEDTHYLVPVFVCIFGLLIHAINGGFLLLEEFGVVHDLADLEELRPIYPSSGRAYLSDWLFFTCT